MFPNQNHAIDGELRAAQRQRFRDRRIQLHRRKLLQPALAHIVFADLIDVDRDEVHWWVMPCPVPAIAFEEPVDDMLRVRVLEVCRADGRQPRPRGTSLRTQCDRRGSHAGE